MQEPNEEEVDWHEEPGPESMSLVRARYQDSAILAAIPEDQREQFLADKALELDHLTETIWRDMIAKPGPPDESYLERVGRFNAMKMQAAEIARANVLPPLEEEDEEEHLFPPTVMTDLAICVDHDLDPTGESHGDPNQAREDTLALEYWRQEYTKMNRRPSIDPDGTLDLTL